MADATATLVKSTAYSAVYHVTSGNDNPAVINYTDAPTLAALVAGPYKAEVKLRAAAGTLDKANLDQNASPRIRIYYPLAISDLTQLPIGAFTVAWTTTGLSITLPGEGEGAQDLYIEIRFIHSARR